MLNQLISNIQNKFAPEVQDREKAALLTALQEAKKRGQILEKTVEKLFGLKEHEEIKKFLLSFVCGEEKGISEDRYHYLLAQCYYNTGALDQAIVFLEKALASDCEEGTYWTLLGDCFLETGQWQRGVMALQAAIRLSPQKTNLIFRLGTIYYEKEKYQEALSCFKECVTKNSFHAPYHEWLGECYLKLGRKFKACQSFRKAAFHGGEVHYYLRLAYCYAHCGEYAKSEKILVKILKTDGEQYEALCYLGGIYGQMGKYRQAYEVLKKAYSQNSQDIMILNNLGYVCGQLGRSRRAQEYYNEALTLNDQDLDVLYNLGICLGEKGDWEGCKKILKKILELDPDHSRAWLLLGNVYEQSDKAMTAAYCYNKGLGCG